MSELTQYTAQWSSRLALDSAMVLELDGNIQEVLDRYNISATDYAKLAKSKAFVAQVDAYRKEIKAKGVPFRMKARAQAEELLSTSWCLIHHPEVSPAVKADLIKSTVKWAGLEPKDSVEPVGGNGGVAITINLGDKTVSAVAATAPVIDMEE